MNENICKSIMIVLLLVCLLFSITQAADNEEPIGISGKVMAGSVNNEVHIRINNNSGKTVLGVKANISESPSSLLNFQIVPEEIDLIAPKDSREFIVLFDVSKDAPQGELEPVKFRLSTKQGGLEETEPEMILTIERTEEEIETTFTAEFDCGGLFRLEAGDVSWRSCNIIVRGWSYSDVPVTVTVEYKRNSGIEVIPGDQSQSPLNMYNPGVSDTTGRYIFLEKFKADSDASTGLTTVILTVNQGSNTVTIPVSISVIPRDQEPGSGSGIRPPAEVATGSCPSTALKREPGICGCNILDTPDNIADADGDGKANCNDRCPKDYSDDSDGDGVCDSLDPCPNDPKPDHDKDNDGVCNSSDRCPNDNPDDTDGDRVCDSEDECPQDRFKVKSGICGCGKPDNDTDGNGIINFADCITQAGTGGGGEGGSGGDGDSDGTLGGDGPKGETGSNGDTSAGDDNPFGGADDWIKSTTSKENVRKEEVVARTQDDAAAISRKDGKTFGKDPEFIDNVTIKNEVEAEKGIQTGTTSVAAGPTSSGTDGNGAGSSDEQPTTTTEPPELEQPMPPPSPQPEQPSEPEKPSQPSTKPKYDWDKTFRKPQYLIHITGTYTSGGYIKKDFHMLFPTPPMDGKLRTPDGYGGSFTNTTDSSSGPHKTPRAVCEAAKGFKTKTFEAWASNQYFNCDNM